MKTVEPAENSTVVAAEVWISSLLRYGVATSVSIVLFGMLLSFWRHPDYASSIDSLERLRNPASATHSLSQLVANASASPGQTLVTFGLLLLISLPVARVFLSLILFRLAGDKVYLRITAIVLVLLVTSFFLGAAH